MWQPRGRRVANCGSSRGRGQGTVYPSSRFKRERNRNHAERDLLPPFLYSVVAWPAADLAEEITLTLSIYSQFLGFRMRFPAQGRVGSREAAAQLALAVVSAVSVRRIFGKRTVMVVPTPTSLWTSMRPPWRATMP